MKSLLLYSLALFGLAQASVIPHPNKITTRASNSTICSNPVPNSCTFYPSCLESRLHCGPSGYPLGYGLHYCELFTNARSQMSPEGQAWVTDTMLCLQRALVPYGTGRESTTCSDVKEYAFGTHPSCYIESGVCTLPPSDWAIIVDTVGLADLFSSWDAFKATMETAGGCGAFYAWLIDSGYVAVLAGSAIEEAGDDIWDWVTSW
jgi:Stanniocalcin family